MTDHAELERRISRALDRLEAPSAPQTLLPSVMAAVHARAYAPWYRREWRLWPHGWQVASAVGSVTLLAGALRWWPSPVLIARLLGNSGVLDGAAALSGWVEPTVSAMQILWRVVFEPVVPALCALVMLTGMACVTLGLTLNYVAFGRTWQR